MMKQDYDDISSGTAALFFQHYLQKYTSCSYVTAYLQQCTLSVTYQLTKHNNKTIDIGY